MDKFPTEDMALTTILVVADAAASKAWYTEVLGAELYGEYGGTSVVLQFCGAWLLLVTGAAPTPDKPSVSFVEQANPDKVDHAFTIRVQDCKASYDILAARGATFLTPPMANGSETRCFFRDPDGHLFEISSIS
jgi:catechol 2,3-dioxygenase-like lactoylglutathione lyase family enzyme